KQIIPAAEPNIPVVTITVAPVKVAAASTRRRRGVVIRDPEEESYAKTFDETNSESSKERRLNQEDKDVEEIKQHLEIVPDEDDDVYTEATPLARKVPVVDYQIILLNNKPRYKIIKANETHQLIMFGRPDGQDNVWKSQRSVHGQAIVKSWKLLTSCGVHIISFTTTQLILLVERRYPLSRFTLEQMLKCYKDAAKLKLKLLMINVAAASSEEITK
nr:hypothetical protein [Tanacetum cinerariifolium]